VARSVWLEKLRASPAAAVNGSNNTSSSATQLLRSNPALKLIDFYEDQFRERARGRSGMAWESGAAEMASESLRGAESIDGAMMERWVKGWCEGV